MWKVWMVAAWLVVGVVVSDSFAAGKVVGESLVLAGEAAGVLLGEDVVPASVVVRSSYLPGGIVYEAGRDYRVDGKAGTIVRVKGSRIADFSGNVLFGRKDFDHSQFPGYGNGKFLVYVDYGCARLPELAARRDVAGLLKKTGERLRAGKRVKVIAFGDSIAAGGEASAVELQFPVRYAELLRGRFAGAEIVVENGATGGDSTVQGLARLEEKVLSREPDLVLVAFGMNDHNIGGVAVGQFKENLKTMVGRIREKTGAEVILLSSFPPHPDWHFGSHRMELYARATKEAAGESSVAYADVYGVWQVVLKRKDPSSLLGNNINHPTDFGHWLYLQGLGALEF